MSISLIQKLYGNKVMDDEDDECSDYDMYDTEDSEDEEKSDRKQKRKVSFSDKSVDLITSSPIETKSHDGLMPKNQNLRDMFECAWATLPTPDNHHHPISISQFKNLMLKRFPNQDELITTHSALVSKFVSYILQSNNGTKEGKFYILPEGGCSKSLTFKDAAQFIPAIKWLLKFVLPSIV